MSPACKRPPIEGVALEAQRLQFLLAQVLAIEQGQDLHTRHSANRPQIQDVSTNGTGAEQVPHRNEYRDGGDPTDVVQHPGRHMAFSLAVPAEADIENGRVACQAGNLLQHGLPGLRGNEFESHAGWYGLTKRVRHSRIYCSTCEVPRTI